MNYYFVPYHIVKDKIYEIIESNKPDFIKHYGDVDVDYEYFEQLSALGMAYVALAIDNNDVVGFAGFVVNENITHKGKEAQNIVFYINEQYRGRGFKRLINYARGEFLKIGVEKMSATVKSQTLARALRSNGFEKQYEIWEIDCE